MSDNGMTTLRCGTEDHGDMDRLLGDHWTATPRVAFSLWICQACGVMAVHLEVPGDIYWYNAQAKTRTSDEPGAARVSLMGPVFGPQGTGHRAGCAYCPTKFDCGCSMPGARHMCVRCDDAAEESKMSAPRLSTQRTDCNCLPDSCTCQQGDPGERADEARQEAAYERNQTDA